MNPNEKPDLNKQLHKKSAKKPKKVSVDCESLLELIHWARRYVDGRYTGVSSDFNRIYDQIMNENKALKDDEFIDETLVEKGKYFPYAVEGDFSSLTRKIQSRCF